MEFMKTYYRQDLHETAKSELHMDTVGAFAQPDVWTTHVLVVMPSLEGSGFDVLMYEVDNEAKGQPPTVDEMAEAIRYLDDASQEETFSTLGEALNNVTGGYGDDIEGLPEDLQAALGECQEAEALAGMSKYARKKYLQQKALEAEEEA